MKFPVNLRCKCGTRAKYAFATKEAELEFRAHWNAEHDGFTCLKPKFQVDALEQQTLCERPQLYKPALVAETKRRGRKKRGDV